VLRSRDEAEGSEAASVLRLTAAETLVENARVVTLDPRRPAATALAIAGGRVVALGARSEVARLADRRTARIDCGGATVLPGLVEPDPLRAAADEVADAQVRLTLVGGRVAWPA